MEREEIIVAAVSAASADVNWLTSDRIEALVGGHGMLNMAVIAIANVLSEELLRGADIHVTFANAPRQPVDDVLAKAIAAAQDAGADAANAALLSAVVLYMVGAEAQVGVPAGNRKLGATARMLAKVDRCGVAAVPTGKMNNKISGFPAVQAIYQAMLAGKLSPVSGRSVPKNVGGGPIYGHSALGEDIIFPAMAINGARIGTQAMLDAMDGAAMPVHPFTAALFGAAAILEIVHPDASVPEGPGSDGRTKSAYLAGKTAAETAGLPAKLHMKITGEEYVTGKVVGELGLILKDVGGPSVIGMMAVDEIMAAFQEGIAGFSGGPLNPPLGHVCADAVVGLKALLSHKGDREAVASALAALRGEISIDPEIALCSMNTVARKASQIRRGAVTDVLILASEPTRTRALYRRAAGAQADLASGRSLADVVMAFEQERQRTVEARASAMFSQMMGKDVKVQVTKLEPGARRKGRIVESHLAFDTLADVEITVDGEVTRLEGFVHDLVPKVAMGERDDIAWAVPLAAAVVDELYLVGNTIINVTVPAAVAAAMGLMSPEEAAMTGEQAGYISAGIPGIRPRAENVCRLAARIVKQK